MKKLIGFRVLIEKEELEGVTASGVILPKADTEWRKGKVIAIGTKVENINLVGERVLYPKWAELEEVSSKDLETSLKNPTMVMVDNIFCTLEKKDEKEK